MENRIRDFRRGDVFLADLGERDLGVNENHLQTGKRPIVIVQNDIGCYFSETVTMVPLTASLKKLGQPTHYVIRDASFLRKQSMAVAEQIATINKHQVIGFLGRLAQADMKGVDDALMIQLGFPIPECVDPP